MVISEKLYTVDSKGKCRTFIIELRELNGVYEIHRKSGLLDGKHTVQPVITITEGKRSKTPLQQAMSEYNSKIKVQKDRKGYKTLLDLGISSEDELVLALGDKKTTASGYQLPQGALDFKGVKNKEALIKKGWFKSLKIDGVRTLVHIHLEEDEHGNERLAFVSRGGLLYEGIARKFEYDKSLIAIAKQLKCQIDGEFYCHGMDLKDINGVCSLKDYDPVRHAPIELWIFDIADDKRVFFEEGNSNCRLALLRDFVTPIAANNSQIVVLEHDFIDSTDALDAAHEKAINDGFEGLILRRGSSVYQYGKKNSSMYKEKKFQDDEFKVIGYKEGLRPIEDMCFVLETADGKTFEAKPQGNLSVKEEYVRNMDNLIGTYGTVKFFNYTAAGIPFLPSFKNFREMKDGKVMF